MRKGAGFRAAAVIFAAACLLSGCSEETQEAVVDTVTEIYEQVEAAAVVCEETDPWYTERGLMSHAMYAGEPFCEINGNRPYFTETRDGAHTLTAADLSGGTDGLPDIRGIPGFRQKNYPGITPRGGLYEPLSLLPEKFGGDPEDGVVAGTEYLTLFGWAEAAAEVETYLTIYPDAEVLWRATPMYRNGCDVCEGILLEYASTDTAALSACRYYYNVQPGIEIDYTDGSSRLEAEPQEVSTVEGD